MAIHMVALVDGEELRITLSRDDAGNYVAEAARLLHGETAQGLEVPHVRVVDPVRELALRSLFDSLHGLASRRRGASSGDDPDPPPAA